MMDLKERKPSREEENRSDHKCCTDCKTTQTPLWRGGPAGPKSLCNACGIRYRKRRIIGVGLDKDSERKNQRTNITFTATTTSATTSFASTATSKDSVCSGHSSSTSASGNKPMRDPLNMSFVVWGKEVMIQRSSTIKKQRCQRRRKLREEEEAAFSLMALSCDNFCMKVGKVRRLLREKG